jgi:hypothetical protein
MRNSPRIRLCERCWRPIAVTVACHIRRHADPEHPFLATLHSFRHLDSDPDCTGLQRTDDEPIRPGDAA